MIPDFDALLYGPLADGFGVTATITPAGGAAIGIVVRDHARAARIGENVEAAVIEPHVIVRQGELADKGVGEDALDGAAIIVNGTDWIVQSHEELPAPHAGGAGEIVLWLVPDYGG